MAPRAVTDPLLHWRWLPVVIGLMVWAGWAVFGEGEEDWVPMCQRIAEPLPRAEYIPPPRLRTELWVMDRDEEPLASQRVRIKPAGDLPVSAMAFLTAQDLDEEGRVVIDLPEGFRGRLIVEGLVTEEFHAGWTGAILMALPPGEHQED